jgi:hypothetical protein
MCTYSLLIACIRGSLVATKGKLRRKPVLSEWKRRANACYVAKVGNMDSLPSSPASSPTATTMAKKQYPKGHRAAGNTEAGEHDGPGAADPRHDAGKTEDTALPWSFLS